MQDRRITQNAVAAIRVSTTKQGTEGDSPEAQKEQIKQFASTHNIKSYRQFRGGFLAVSHLLLGAN